MVGKHAAPASLVSVTSPWPWTQKFAAVTLDPIEASAACAAAREWKHGSVAKPVPDRQNRPLAGWGPVPVDPVAPVAPVVPVAPGTTVIAFTAASASAWEAKHGGGSPQMSPVRHTVWTKGFTTAAPNSVSAAVSVSKHPKLSCPSPMMQAWSVGRSFTEPRARPGICTSMFVPETKSCGSAVPNASMRLRMFSRAWSITACGVPSGACRITETPPSRSRPRTGRTPATYDTTEATMSAPTNTRDTHKPRLRFTPAPLR